MKIIFLHGLGQDETAWDEVIKALPNHDCLSVKLFERDVFPTDFKVLENKVLSILESIDEDFILVGLSLGAMLALDMAQFELNNLKGIVVSGGQYKLKGNLAFYMQYLLFACTPARVFEKHGVDKQALKAFYDKLSQFDLTKVLRELNLPVQIFCGQKDKANLPAAKAMHKLMAHSQLALIPQGGHTLNTECPEEFADRVERFLTSVSLS